MRAFHSDRFVLPLPPGPPFPALQVPAAARARRGARRTSTSREADAGQRRPISSASTARRTSRRCSAARSSAPEQRAIGFPWSAEMVDRSRRSVGATMAAARAALAEGVAANLAGGTHHAAAARGSGYCVFNDVAVAARTAAGRSAAARRRRRSRRSPGRRHARRSSPATTASSRSRCTARRTSRSARQRATSTSTCPTAAPTPQYLAALDDALAALWRRARGAAVRPRLLSRRRRSARGRPPRPAQAERRRAARARPSRARRGCARAASRWRWRWPAATATTSTSRSRSRPATIAAAIESWRAWRDVRSPTGRIRSLELAAVDNR